MARARGIKTSILKLLRVAITRVSANLYLEHHHGALPIPLDPPADSKSSPSTPGLGETVRRRSSLLRRRHTKVELHSLLRPHFHEARNSILEWLRVGARGGFARCATHREDVVLDSLFGTDVRLDMLEQRRTGATKMVPR